MAELVAAAQVLGVREVIFLDYIDGDVDKASPGEAIARIATHLRRIRPQVVVTADPQGWYGHPDHIATIQLTLGALVKAAGSNSDQPPPPGLQALLRSRNRHLPLGPQRCGRQNALSSGWLYP